MASITPVPFPVPPNTFPISGGLRFQDMALMICGIVDNGVCPDDPRVMVRLNEATKIILDYLIPVGGMISANIIASNEILILPPQMENAIEAHPLEVTTGVFGDKDITQAFYQITNNSTYLDPAQQYDCPMVDLGLSANPADPSDVRRIYRYPGLQPPNAVVSVTGAKRFVPVTNDQDYPIVQNVHALKLIILSIERNENSVPDEAQKYRQQAFELLQAEVKKHILDPANYMFRKAGYLEDISRYPVNSLGWMRGQIALDLDDALRDGKRDLTWSLNQAERRLMERGSWKDTVVTIQANVVGGVLYMPNNVEGVLALNLNGHPIPIRSQFFQQLENGPGGFPCHDMLIDQGDKLQPGFHAPRRKYKLIANCEDISCITAVVKLRWVMKKPGDMMTIKNYEAMRLMMTAKFMEEGEKWQEAQVKQQQAVEILDKELRNFLGGIRHTVHVQTDGFGLGDVGNYWTR